MNHDFFIPFLSPSFFPYFWSFFFFKNTSQTIFFPPYRDGKGCSETCIYCRCLSLRNKDTKGKMSGAVFCGGPQRKGMRGSDLMEMVKITQKKDDMKKENRGKNSWQRKRAKIKIEKMGGRVCQCCHVRLESGKDNKLTFLFFHSRRHSTTNPKLDGIFFVTKKGKWKDWFFYFSFSSYTYKISFFSDKIHGNYWFFLFC